MKILVCGGRDYAMKDRRQMRHVIDILDRAALRYGQPLEIMEGGATGADTMAWLWATMRAIKCETFPADWNTHRHAAGPIRNKQMVDRKPDMVIAFPGGKGTENCCEIAEAAGIRVVRP